MTKFIEGATIVKPIGSSREISTHVALMFMFVMGNWSNIRLWIPCKKRLFRYINIVSHYSGVEIKNNLYIFSFNLLKYLLGTKSWRKIMTEHWSSKLLLTNSILTFFFLSKVSFLKFSLYSYANKSFLTILVI